MFRLKSSEGPVRFLYQQALHRRHHNLFMAYLIGYDPCSHLSKAFSHYPLSSSDRGSYISLPYLHNLVYANVFGVSRSIGFSIRSCSFVTSGDCSSSSSSNGNRIMVKAKAKPRGFASYPRQPMLADLEQENSVRDDGCDAAPVNSNGLLSGNPGKPLCFRDHPLPQKLTVAVDVDEGMYAHMTCISMCHSFNIIDYRLSSNN